MRCHPGRRCSSLCETGVDRASEARPQTASGPSGRNATRRADHPPPVMVKLLLIALVRPLAVAVSVYVPVASRVQPAKVATPATALMGFAVQVREGPPGGVTASVTEAVRLATVLPPAS